MLMRWFHNQNSCLTKFLKDEPNKLSDYSSVRKKNVTVYVKLFKVKTEYQWQLSSLFESNVLHNSNVVFRKVYCIVCALFDQNIRLFDKRINWFLFHYYPLPSDNNCKHKIS